MSQIQTKNTNIKPKPPVVVIMGHIDHGKSTLLDYIRKSNIVAGEAGGITQHLGAYEVAYIPDEDKSEGKSGLLTFIDTPGHSAFNGIRTRGASSADIAILIVSAEEGVKPQTVEAYKCIKEAGIPFIVAISKIDKPSADIERTKASLAENEIYLEGYGGDISFVPISSVTGEGIPELLEMILLMAEVADLKAPQDGTPTGVVVEAHLDPKKGIGATIIMKQGTLKSGMYVLAGDALSPVRIFENCYGASIKEAKPGRPARIIGFDLLPLVGSDFIAFDDKKSAEKAREEYVNKIRAGKLKNNAGTFTQISNSKDNEKVEMRASIPIIIKADTFGSLEGIKSEIKKLNQERVSLNIISENIGRITENDIKMAIADPKTIILAFNVKLDSSAKGLAERSGIRVEIYNIIYRLVEFLEKLLLDNTPKIKIEESTGLLKVLQVFGKEKDRQIIGGKVQSGYVKLGSEVKILRRDAEIGSGRIKELQQNKKKTEEVASGYECGLLVESKIEIAIGDKIQPFIVVEK